MTTATHGIHVIGEHTLYEKCGKCHLFIDENTAWVPDGTYSFNIARYIHLARGDDADEAIEETHEATPSGLLATTDVWEIFGPEAMRFRFVPDDFDPLDNPEPDVVGDFLYWAKCVVAAKNSNVSDDIHALIDTMAEHISATSTLMNMDRSGSIDNLDEIIGAARNIGIFKEAQGRGMDADWLGAIDTLDALITQIGAQA